MSATDERRSSSRTRAAETDDHEIQLVDSTSPTSPTSALASPLGPDPPRRSQDSSGDRKWTKTTLREELARRKYARFQEDRYAEEDSRTSGGQGDKSRFEQAASAGGKAIDRGRERIRQTLRRSKASKRREKEAAAVDILYENQRGLFVCGIPYYSSQSLLNFDPAAWTDAAFKDSAVNITNAQVPDPTWSWVWKSWYVDMSHDVDEEGWEYLFSFHQSFVWHGTHPFFYSWVRRRRWLRKRIKMHSPADHMLADTMTEAHRLAPDYFTIHTGKRGPSRSSSRDRHDNRSSFFNSSRVVGDTESESEDEITDVVALLKAMKSTTVDRKKLSAFRNFVENGGDEVCYIAKEMDEIIGMFVYQNSRRQLLSILEHAASEYTGPSGSGKKKPVSQRAEGLADAIEALKESIAHLEYWSDIKSAEGQATRSDASSQSSDSLQDRKAKLSIRTKDINREVSSVRIEGIPSSAELDVEPGIMRPLGYMRHKDESGRSPTREEKGKEKA